MDAQKKEKCIKSPLVRYNEFDQPVCRVCHVVIKSESSWDAHQVSRKHCETSQWLRSAVSGAIKGLVSTASILMVVGEVQQNIKAMIQTGFVWLVVRACNMAIMKFVFVSSQLDIEVAQMKRGKERGHSREREEEDTNEEKGSLPNPIQATAASALAFSVGAMVPLLAASFIREYKVGLRVAVAAVSFVLVVFGGLKEVLGKAPLLRYAVMVGETLFSFLAFILKKKIRSITSFIHM